MRVVAITATAGRKSQHPTEAFANVLVSATFTAELQEGDDVASSAITLQRMVDAHVEEAKAQALKTCSQQPQWSKDSAKAQTATEDKAASLAAKHRGK